MERVLRSLATFFLFVTLGLLMAISLSAPTSNFGFLNVKQMYQLSRFYNRLGLFGSCTIDNSQAGDGGPYCTSAKFGYDFSSFIPDPSARPSGIVSLSRALVLHPIATGITGIVLMISLINKGLRLPSILIAWALVLTTTIIETILFTKVNKAINRAGYYALAAEGISSELSLCFYMIEIAIATLTCSVALETVAVVLLHQKRGDATTAVKA